MKYTIKKIGFVFLTVTLILSGCKKNFLREELNDDPTSLINPDPKVLLPAAIANMAYYYGGDYARFNSLLTQQVSGASAQWLLLQTYSFVGSDFNSCWNSTFVTTLNNLNKMGIYSKEKKFLHYQGISKVLTAFAFSVIVDHWGDAPFAEALQGLTILQPKYDKGELIYSNIISTLNEAEVLLTSTDNGRVPGNEDLLFKGNTDSWIAFSHALKSRMYLHIKEYEKSKAELILAKGIDVKMNFSTPSSGPMNQFNNQRVGDLRYMDSYLYKTMESLGDARIYAYVDTAEDDLGSLYDVENQPIFLISAMEQKFIEAEIAARTGDEMASQILKDAMNLSFAFAGNDTTGFAASLAAHPYNNADPLPLRLKAVMMQKYFALFLQPETFADWRRTGFPELNPKSGTNIPRRYLYPSDETNANPNTPTGVTMFQPKVFWDNE
jgi:hypothetical protein